MTKIGVWNTAFLGDAVLTLPLLATLRANYPDARIHYWVRAGLEPLIAHQPEIDAVHGVCKRCRDKGLLGARALARRIARERYDLWLSAHASFRSGLIACWASVPKRVGYSRPWWNAYFYTRTVDRRFTQLHEIDRLLQLATALDVQKIVRRPRMVHAPLACKAADILWEELVQGPVLGVHPGSVWPTKRWPAAYFGQVMRLAADAGTQIMLFAGPGEEKEAASALEASGLDPNSSQLLDVAGKLTLPELAACIGKLDCYLTNDSGPMHLAWMQETPVVALFGPTTRDLGFSPLGERSVVLEQSLYCRPCGLHGHQQCPKVHHACMRDIAPKHVWQAVQGQLFP